MAACRNHPTGTHSRTFTVRPIIAISAAGILLLGLLLAVSAAACLRADAGDAVLRLCAYCCCAIAALVTGFVAGKTAGRSGAVFGLPAALPQCLLLLILCLALHKSVGVGFLIACVVIAVCALLGGLGSVRLRRRRRYR